MERYDKILDPQGAIRALENAVIHKNKQLADAQATIAALQARVKELEEITKVICGHCCEPMEILSKAVLQSALTQRTAKLETAKQWKLQLCNLTPGGSEFADDPAYCAEWVRKSRENQHNVILDKYREAKSLKAELERVRGERDKAKQVTENVYKMAREDAKEYEQLRTLIAALPKVEGAVVVSNGYVNDSTRCRALFGADEDAALYAALLQHRQGMEG